MWNSENNHKLSAVYQEFFPILIRYGLRYNSNFDVVKDCIHDVFLNLCEKENISEIRAMGPYLLRSLKNALLNYESRTPKYHSIDETSHNYRHECSVEDQFIKSETEQLDLLFIENALNILTDKEKEIVYLFYIEQKNYDDICKITGLTRQYAKKLVHKALGRIRENISSVKIF